MSLPVNFEEKVKLPPAANGTGYPYRISAKDMMRDFVYASVIVPDQIVGGVRNGIKEKTVGGIGGHIAREIYAEAFPQDPVSGDMMYYDGSEWIRLPAPSSSGVSVLSHDGTKPTWLSTEECS